MEATLAADLITAFFSKFFAALALKISDNGLKTRLKLDSLHQLTGWIGGDSFYDNLVSLVREHFRRSVSSDAATQANNTSEGMQIRTAHAGVILESRDI